MKTRLLTIIGMVLFLIAIILHYSFLSSDAVYLETFSNPFDCKIFPFQIVNNLNASLENNCSTQLHLIQHAFVMLFLGLGTFLIVGGIFLEYSGRKENEN